MSGMSSAGASPECLHVVQFLSRATPLTRWQETGLYEREVALYKALADRVDQFSLVTSGGSAELAYQADLARIRILLNRWGLSPNTYSLLAPWLHRNLLRQATVYRTNQLDGAWTAILAGKLHRKPVIVRAGYLWAELERQAHGLTLRTRLVTWLQRACLRHSSHILVTSQALADDLVRSRQADPSRITVIPNYVDTRLFHPDLTAALPGRACFVGRLHPVKNLDSLVKAFAPGVQGETDLPGNAHLVVIGAGQQKQVLQQLARTLGSQVAFTGALPHAALPAEISRSQVFVLPSLNEGHPKALIEAMACGVAVLGADSPGIREVIRHGETGWLCHPDPGSLRQALQTLLTDEALRLKLGANARQFALEQYALEKIVDQELDLLLKVAGEPHGSQT